MNWQKYITRILFLHNIFFWMIKLIIPEMNIIEVSSLIQDQDRCFLVKKDSWPYQLQ